MAMAAVVFSASVFSNAVRVSSGGVPSSLSSVVCSRSRPLLVVCHSEPGGGGSCCGGSGGGGGGGGSGGGGSCSSHGKNSLANLGKEFEHLVATNTLLEFEKNYNSSPMQGNITRDIIDTVMETFPEGSELEEGQKFLDVNEILEEARSMSNGDFIFSEDSDFVLV